MTILVVDDIQENRYLLNVLFSSKGYEVIEAENGEQALTKIRKQLPEAIISDILMPIMDGFALCKEVKSDPALKKIPFIFYTATYTEESDKEFALSLGAEKFLIKPMGLNDLAEEVEQVLTSPVDDVNQPENMRNEFHKEHSKHLQHKLEQKIAQLESKNTLLLSKQREVNLLNEHLELLTSRRQALLASAPKEMEPLLSAIEAELAVPKSILEQASQHLYENNREKLDKASLDDLEKIVSAVESLSQILNNLNIPPDAVDELLPGKTLE